MFKKFLPVIFALVLTALAAPAAFGQLIDASTRSGRPKQEEPPPKNVLEHQAKVRIEQEKKEYDELVKRTEEAAQLSKELENSFAGSQQLSAEDRKKLDRLEKLLKKIRGDLGGDETEEEENKEPSSLRNAFNTLQADATKLFDEVKKSTRYSISVVAIQSSNALIRLVRFIRSGR